MVESAEVGEGPFYRAIPRFPDYLFGRDGSVWSRKIRGRWRQVGPWRRMAPVKNKDGYLVVHLTTDEADRAFFVHPLILEAFVGPRPEGMEACHHPDSDPTNNALDNLRWDTSKANKADMEAHGRRAKGSRSGRAKLVEDDVREIRRRAAQGEKAPSIARTYKVDPKAIRLILNGTNWAHLV